MNSYNYDLHIHSCLSPCADDDMTPANIAGMAHLQGLNIVALTDHNSSKNCPAFFAHAKKYGIVPIAGMELTTAEDIHVICLFDTLDSAMEFDGIVERRLMYVKNRPDIFGCQLIMNENDETVGEIEPLLINATDIDLDEAYKICTSMGGACYPAHIDRDSGGMISILGNFPDNPKYAAFELNFKESLEEYMARFPVTEKMQFVVSSDAHNLWKISDAGNTLSLDDEPYSSQKVRESLIKYLRG
ncbi:MAG: PHP domain-containing protein [Clostridiales bacterium]|nr:PHP domain-containing protein [Clostridiales bacterium]